jgi:signal transduction histidine kinase
MTLPLEFSLELRSAIIVVTGELWTVQSFNQTASRWLGESLSIGAHILDSLPDLNQKTLSRRLKKGRTASFDCTVMDPQSTLVEFSCTYTSQIEGGVILEGLEMTRAKSAEFMLNSYSMMIEEKTRDLEAAISARDAFFATISHELRTPLNAMIGFSESLLDDIYGDLTIEQKSVLERVYANGQNLLSMLNNLLYLSRLRSGKLSLSLKVVDVLRICERVIKDFEEESSNKEIDLEIESEALFHVKVDEEWCKKMIDNLVDNAIKFTPRGKRAGIKIGTGPIGLRVTVWDEGIGISNENKSLIFQAFIQVESSLSRPYQGSGLGLALVAEISHLHGGEISVSSQLGQGSQFYLDLPCETRDQSLGPA